MTIGPLSKNNTGTAGNYSNPSVGVDRWLAERAVNRTFLQRALTRGFHYHVLITQPMHRTASVFRSTENVAKKIGNVRACGKQLEPCFIVLQVRKWQNCGAVRRGALLNLYVMMETTH